MTMLPKLKDRKDPHLPDYLFLPEKVIIQGTQYELEELHKALSKLIGVHSETQQSVITESFNVVVRKVK